MIQASVIYYSKTGTTAEMAGEIVAGMNAVEGVQARAFPIEAVDEEWAKASQCLVFGTPIYAATVASPMAEWMQSGTHGLELAGKLGGAFATANWVQGGGDLGIRTILDQLLVYGMMTYSGGMAWDRPVIHLGPVAIREHLDDYRAWFRLYGERMAKQAVRVFG